MTISSTAAIVAAYLSHNPMSPDRVPGFIESVHRTVTGLAIAPDPDLTPAVAIDKRFANGKVACIECGWSGQSLKRHLTSAHGFTPEQYRERWGLPKDDPMVTALYSDRRSEIARAIGLGKRA